MNNVSINELNIAFNKLLHRFYDLSDENKELKKQISKLQANKTTMQGIRAGQNNKNSSASLFDNVSKEQTKKQNSSYILDETLKNGCTSEDLDKINSLIDSFKQ